MMDIGQDHIDDLELSSTLFNTSFDFESSATTSTGPSIELRDSGDTVGSSGGFAIGEKHYLRYKLCKRSPKRYTDGSTLFLLFNTRVQDIPMARQ